MPAEGDAGVFFGVDERFESMNALVSEECSNAVCIASCKPTLDVSDAEGAWSCDAAAR